MTKKSKLIAAGVVLLLVAYGTYNKLTMVPIPIGELCTSSGGCEGVCLGFGELRDDYTQEEMCTKECSSDSDCPAPTSCEIISLITSDNKGSEVSETGYCLKPMPKEP